MPPATLQSPPQSPAPNQAPNVPGKSPNEPWGWTPRQRRGLGILATLLLAILILQYLRRPAPLDDPLLPVSSSLPRRVDPNTATREQLARLPHLGDVLAQKIIDYREPRKASAPDAVVFRQPSDLDPIPGIGKGLIDQLAPFLIFPDNPEPTP